MTLNLTPDSAPGGEAVWSSEPAGISGTGSSMTFDPCSLAPGVYTVTARSSIVPSYYDTCVVRVFRLYSDTIAIIPPDRARAEIGVAEEVHVFVSPEAGAATWSVSGGGEISSTNGFETTFKAPHQSSTCVVSCNVGQITLSKEFKIFEPSGVVRAVVNSTRSFPVGEASAMMQLYPVVVGPTNVSFYNVVCVEVGRDAVNLTGYWATNSPPSHIGNGADVWFPLDQANQWPPSWDYAGLFNVAQPWGDGGSFEWPIPAEWKVGQTGMAKPLCGWNQKFELTSEGTVTIRKWDKWVTRTTNDVVTTN